MAKKKTSVLLPGGIQGLVHDLQNGTSNFAPRPIVTTDDDEEEEDNSASAPVASQPSQVVEPSEQQPAAVAEPAQNQTVIEPSGTQNVAVEQASYAAPAAAQTPQQTPVPSSTTATNREPVQTAPAPAPQVAPVEVEPVPETNVEQQAQVGRGRPPKENTMREYHIVQDNSKDSWDLFIDMAQQYKNGGGKLATIYIDETLKSVLDRLKYAGPEKLSTSAILSSIVARFIYDHEEAIKKALFSGNLL